MSLLLLRVCHPNQHHHQLRRALPTSAWNKITNINPYITNISRRQRTISSSRITIERVTDDSHFLQRPDQKDLVFGTVLTDHMLEVEWKKDQKSWSAPRIVPYHDLQISPAASCLHYGTIGIFWQRNYAVLCARKR